MSPRFYRLFIQLLIGFSFFGSLACQKKETSENTPDTDKKEILADDFFEKSVPDAEHAKGVLSQAKMKTIDPKSLGFANRLPKDSEFYAAVYSPLDLFDSLEASGAGEFLFSWAGEHEGKLAWDDEGKDKFRSGMKKLRAVLGRDFFFCLDRGASVNVHSLGEIYQDTQSMQVQLFAKIVSRYIKLGDTYKAVGDPKMKQYVEDALTNLSQIQKKILDESGRFTIPRIYLGCIPPEKKGPLWMSRWKDFAHRVADQNDGVTEIHFLKYGTSFCGVRVNVSQLTEKTFQEVQQEIKNKIKQKVKNKLGHDLDDALNQALKDIDASIHSDERVLAFENRLKNRWKSIEFICVLGMVDDHLVMFIGEDQKDLFFADRFVDSLASRSEFNLVGNGKLVASWYVNKSLLAAIQFWRGYEEIYRSLAEAFSQEPLPNSDEIVKEFSQLAELQNKLQNRKIDDYMMLLVRDRGVRIETMGGRRDVKHDFSKPLQLLPVVKSLSERRFFTMHWQDDESYHEMACDSVEHFVTGIGKIIEGGYLAFLQRSEQGSDWYEQARKVYGEIIVSEVRRFWHGYRTLTRDGWTREGAVVVDLNGHLPKVIGVSNQIINQGKVPRLLFVRPVKDRSSIQSSYRDFHATMENVLGYASKNSDKYISMPDFISSSKGGLTTWFYSFPMITEDFIPGVSVSDSLWMAGTSMRWARELHQHWKERQNPPSVDCPRGVLVEVSLDPLWDFSQNWLDLYEAEEQSKKQSAIKTNQTGEDGDEIINTSNTQKDVFNYARARRIINRLRWFRSIHWHRWSEDGVMRNTYQLKVGKNR